MANSCADSINLLPTTTSPTPTPTPISAVNGISTGAIAGIAVGAALGGILIFCFVLFFVWRHRKQRHLQKLKQGIDDPATAEEFSKPEKAQLHSDEYRPHREELPGSKAPLRVRTVGGLNEMEHSPLERTYSEMAANEPAGSELKGDLRLSPTTDSLTLVSSGLRNEVSR